MERLGGPQEVRDGVLDSLAHGTPVTAKVSWLSTPSMPGSPHRTSIEGKPRWIHCTPMLGSDEKVGVWNFPSPPPNVMGRSSLDTPVRGGEGARSPRFKAETGKMYAEYLRREGKGDTPLEGFADGPTSSPREARPFQDF
jgi:hypothetical protein